MPANRSQQLNATMRMTSSSTTEEKKSHFSQSAVLVEESANSSKDVIMNVNRAEANDFDLNSNAAAAIYDTTERQVSVQNENVENGSITKKSALQFFKNAIEENKVEKPAEKPLNGGNLNFVSPVAAATTTTSSSYRAVEENVSNVSSFVHKQFNDPTEVVLEPGPPPTFDYMPRAVGAQCVKKDQMTERLRRLSTNQKLLSPEQIPSGAVRIFPDVTSETTAKREAQTTEENHRAKNVTVESSESSSLAHHHQAAGPLLRPRADIEVRPGSPRPSAEAISMEKLWSKAHSAQHVRSSPVLQQQTKTYDSSESQSFVSETVERNGELVKDETREEKSGCLNIDDGVRKISERFSEVSVGPTPAAKHVEPPRYETNRRPASAKVLFDGESAATDSFGNKTIRTQRFSEEFSEQVKTSSQYLPEPRGSTMGLVKHVEPPNHDKTTASRQFARSRSEETAAGQWMTQQSSSSSPPPPIAFKGPPNNKLFESHHRSSFTQSLERDGVSVASERREEEGGRTVDDSGVRSAYSSFSERSKSQQQQQQQHQPATRSNSSGKSNSIKTMQKMFEQTGSGGGGGGSGQSMFGAGTNVRPYSRMKFGASDSDFESEAELSKYCNTEQQQNVSECFESKMYTSKTQLQEIKSTSTIALQSPVKESGYAADTDEPTRGFQTDDRHSHQTTFNSKRNNNSGFQSAFIKKVRLPACVYIFVIIDIVELTAECGVFNPTHTKMNQSTGFNIITIFNIAWFEF